MGQDHWRIGAANAACVKKLDFKFTLTMAAYDLIKLPRLIGVTA